MRIEIFKVGTQTDSAGNAREWTEADLDKIASSYNPANHEAPVCIGHPKDNAPAWGWVKSVTRDGSSLFAEIGDLVAEFSDMLSKKMFKKRSISLYPDLSLRHIGFLGAQPPAVKGLADFKFSEGLLPLEYADWETTWSFNGVGRLFQGLRDWLIETKDIATADKLLPQYDIDPLKAMRPTPEPMNTGYTETSTEDTDMDKVTELQATIVDFTEKLSSETAKVTAAVARATSAESRVAVLEKEKTRGDLGNFCERMVNAGKMLPAQKGNHVAVMESLHGQADIEFTEGTATVKKSPLKAYQDAIENGAKLITFGEFAKGGTGGDDMGDAVKIAEKATTYKEQRAKEGVEVTFTQAVEHVTAKA